MQPLSNFPRYMGVITMIFENFKTRNDEKTVSINFSCINSLSSSPAEKDESSGIGLELIKKRLELIYSKAYELKIYKTEQSFAVYLKIKTNAN